IVKQLNPDLCGGIEARDLRRISVKDFRGSFILVPNFYFVEQPRTKNRLRISAQDFLQDRMWGNPGAGVKGIHDTEYRAQFLRADGVGYTLRGNRPTLHEAGHALLDLLEKIDPQYYKRFRAKLEAAYRRAQSREQFFTKYAEHDLDDFFAESF